MPTFKMDTHWIHRFDNLRTQLTLNEGKITLEFFNDCEDCYKNILRKLWDAGIMVFEKDKKATIELTEEYDLSDIDKLFIFLTLNCGFQSRLHETGHKSSSPIAVKLTDGVVIGASNDAGIIHELRKKGKPKQS